MSPWDELRYFNSPKVSVINVPSASAGTQILSADPMRVVAVFGFQGSGSAQAAFVQPNQSQITATGMILQSTQLPLILTARDHPSLCQAAWYAVAGVGITNMEMLEVSMHDWPNTEGSELALVLAALKKILALRS